MRKRLSWVEKSLMKFTWFLFRFICRLVPWWKKNFSFIKLVLKISHFNHWLIKTWVSAAMHFLKEKSPLALVRRDAELANYRKSFTGCHSKTSATEIIFNLQKLCIHRQFHVSFTQLFLILYSHGGHKQKLRSSIKFSCSENLLLLFFNQNFQLEKEIRAWQP